MSNHVGLLSYFYSSFIDASPMKRRILCIVRASRRRYKGVVFIGWALLPERQMKSVFVVVCFPLPAPPCVES